MDIFNLNDNIVVNIGTIHGRVDVDCRIVAIRVESTVLTKEQVKELRLDLDE